MTTHNSSLFFTIIINSGILNNSTEASSPYDFGIVIWAENSGQFGQPSAPAKPPTGDDLRPSRILQCLDLLKIEWRACHASVARLC
jgi:hypothetical protein